MHYVDYTSTIPASDPCCKAFDEDYGGPWFGEAPRGFSLFSGMQYGGYVVTVAAIDALDVLNGITTVVEGDTLY